MSVICIGDMVDNEAVGEGEVTDIFVSPRTQKIVYEVTTATSYRGLLYESELTYKGRNK